MRDDVVKEGGRRWERPPLLYVVRDERLPLPPPRPPAEPRRRDSMAFGLAIAGSMLLGLVMACAAVWWR